MPRKPRGRVFMFDPDLFLTDPAVRRMTLAALGAYVRLLCEAWRSHDPGIIEADDDTIRRLAMVDSADWPTLRPQVAAAFDVDSKPGTWVQKRVRETYRAQSRMIQQKRVSGKLGAKARWGGITDHTPKPDDTSEDEWHKHSTTIAQPWRNHGGSMVLGSKPLGNVVTVPDSKPLGGRATEKSVRLSDAMRREKLDPKTEAQAVTCGHLMWEQETATRADALCPLCLRAEVERLRAYLPLARWAGAYAHEANDPDPIGTLESTLSVLWREWAKLAPEQRARLMEER